MSNVTDPAKLRTLPSELLLFASHDPASLIEKIKHTLENFVSIHSLVQFAYQTQDNFAIQQRVNDANSSVRLAIVAADLDHLRQKLQQALIILQESPQTSFSLLQGIYYGVNINPGKVMMLFPGQDSEYCGMGSDLANTFATCLNVWNDASRLSNKQDNLSLTQVVFPPAATSWEEYQRYEQRLANPAWAQLALTVAGLAQFQLLQQILKINPDYVAGHGFGELTALCIAGVLDLPTLSAIVNKQDELIRQIAQVPSALLRVSYPIEKILAFVNNNQLDVTPAQLNSPNQLVLAGSLESINTAEALFTQTKIKCQRLAVEEGLYSYLVESLYQPLHAFFDHLPFATPQIPVYANATGKPYPTEAVQIRQLLAKQLVSPILFNEQIEQAYQQGVRTFIEVGPHNVLTSLVGQCLSRREFHAISLDRKGEKGATALWHALGRLIVIGLNPQLMALWEEYNPLEEDVFPQIFSKSPVVSSNDIDTRPGQPGAAIMEPARMADVLATGELAASHPPMRENNGDISKISHKCSNIDQNTQIQLILLQEVYQKIMTDGRIQFLNTISQLDRY